MFVGKSLGVKTTGLFTVSVGVNVCGVAAIAEMGLEPQYNFAITLRVYSQ